MVSITTRVDAYHSLRSLFKMVAKDAPGKAGAKAAAGKLGIKVHVCWSSWRFVFVITVGLY